jgi:GNAT superfamily N-acetyltransferase
MTTAPVLSVPSEAEIAADWEEFTGGPPVVGALGTYRPPDVDAIRLVTSAGSGIVTWAVRGQVAELVSLHADPPGAGVGDNLLHHAEERSRSAGAGRMMIVTTNDNPRALTFYIREGYRLIRIELDAMDDVRRLKPGVPLTGNGGIPLRDHWVLEKTL